MKHKKLDKTKNIFVKEKKVEKSLKISLRSQTERIMKC